MLEGSIEVDMFLDTNYLFFDFETSGTLPEYALQPWRHKSGDMWATSLAYMHQLNSRPAMFGDVAAGGIARQVIADMLALAIDNRMTVVGWNVVFDIAILLAYGFHAEVAKINWLDGMLLWKHLANEPEYDTIRTKKKSYSLKQAVWEFLPQHAGYEDGVDFHTKDEAALAELLAYNKRDVVFTARLTKMFFGLLSAQQLKAAMLEAKCLPLVADANLRGIPLDRSALSALGTMLDARATDALAELAPHGVSEEVVRSPKKLAELLFDVWGLPIYKQTTGKTTGAVSRSTDKEALHELSFIDPRAKVLRTYRESLGNKTKFVEKPQESLDYSGDGCSRPQAVVFSTYTGRLTYSSTQGKNSQTKQIGFALHQEKRDPQFRAIAVAPEGHTIVEFDAAGQEYRWMALASMDDTMLRMCMPGEDAHGYMGAKIAHMEYEELLARKAAGDKSVDPIRQLGKVANLSCGYRTSAGKLRTVARVQYNLPMDLVESKHIWGMYRQTYPGVPKYWSTQIAHVKRCGYAETFAGRRVAVTGDWGGTLGWSLESTAINYRIQGTGADQKYLALAVLRPYMTKHNILFAWELHDGLYFFVPDAVVERSIAHMRYLLNNLPYKKAWGYTPRIPLPWDCKVGKTWGNLKEVKEP